MSIYFFKSSLAISDLSFFLLSVPGSLVSNDKDIKDNLFELLL